MTQGFLQVFDYLMLGSSKNCWKLTGRIHIHCYEGLSSVALLDMHIMHIVIGATS